jgi:hypothetical protein
MVSVLFLQASWVHASGLDGVEHVEANLDEVGNDRIDRAIGVVGDIELGIQVFQRGIQLGPFRFDQPAPQVW